MLNKAQVIGHLGQDPKITQGRNGVIASFSVVTTEKGYTTRDGVQVPERTEWHNIVCFGRIAEVVQAYLKKGSKVFVEGKNGVKRTIMEINAELLEMLDNKPTTQQKQAYQPQQPQPTEQKKEDDDLPF